MDCNASEHRLDEVIAIDLQRSDAINMFPQFDLLLSSFSVIALFTTVVVAQNMSCEPFPVLPRIISLFDSFQGRKSVIKLCRWIKARWEVYNADIYFVS